MIRVKVILHSYLRECLPLEDDGQVELDFPPGSCLKDIIVRLKLPEHISIAINRQIERDLNSPLKDGDEIRFFRPGAGG